jgi:hypothetical protein
MNNTLKGILNFSQNTLFSFSNINILNRISHKINTMPVKLSVCAILNEVILLNNITLAYISARFVGRPGLRVKKKRRKKMGRIVFLAILLISMFSFYSCTAPSGSQGQTNSENKTSSVSIKGTVFDCTTGKPVQGAVVSVSGTTVQTDANGNYSLTVTGSQNILINASHDSYADTGRSIAVSGNSAALADFYLKKFDASVKMDLTRTTGNSVALANGVKVKFPQISSITEQVTVNLAYFNAGSDEFLSAPGNMEYIESGNNVGNLQSFGMLDVTVVGDSGKVYSLNGLGTYELTIPISGDIANAPATIPLWYYDTESGYWKQEGTASKNGSTYVGNVNHFTTWNLDFKITGGCNIHGSINDNDVGEYYEISVLCSGYSKKNVIYDKDFTLLRLPLDAYATISIKKSSTNEICTKNLLTANTPSSTVEIGEFSFLPSIYPNILNLSTVVGKYSVDVSWDDPASAIYDHAEISIFKLGETNPQQTVNIAKGVKTAQFSGLPTGNYYVSATAVYNDNGKSAPVSKTFILIKLMVDYLTAYMQDLNAKISWAEPYRANYPDYGGVELTVTNDAGTYTKIFNEPKGTTTLAIPGLSFGNYTVNAVAYYTDNTKSDVTVSTNFIMSGTCRITMIKSWGGGTPDPSLAPYMHMYYTIGGVRTETSDNVPIAIPYGSVVNFEAVCDEYTNSDPYFMIFTRFWNVKLPDGSSTLIDDPSGLSSFHSYLNNYQVTSDATIEAYFSPC